MEKQKIKQVHESTDQQVASKLRQHAAECKNSWCPFHGSDPVKLRGRVFEGIVVKKFTGRITIEFERIRKISKYERFEKRKTKLHARLPDCLKDIEQGDLVQIAECRPLSKIIHFIVVKKIRSREDKK